MSLYTIFIYTVPFIAVLTVIVFFHEMGHFLVGRLCGVKVDAFSLGFGPELAHYVDKRGTRWRLALLPLGGYVKFHGDGDGASMTRAPAEAMDKSERSVTLFGQNVWKRMAIVGAGPVANFIVSIAIFAGLFTLEGRTLTVPRVSVVQADSAAAAAGFKPQDLITAIDGRPLQSFEEMKRMVQASDGSSLSFTLARDGQTVTLTAQPRRKVLSTPFGPAPTYLLGLEANGGPGNVRMERAGPLQALGMAVDETWFVVDSTGHFVRDLFIGRESTEQLSGPYRIAQVSGRVAQLGIGPLFNLAAILSISIGLLNLLPIPVLDGGFLMFFAIEAIRGRAVRERTMEVAFRVGLSFVAALSSFVFINDVTHPLPGRPVAADGARR